MVESVGVEQWLFSTVIGVELHDAIFHASVVVVKCIRNIWWKNIVPQKPGAPKSQSS